MAATQKQTMMWNVILGNSAHLVISMQATLMVEDCGFVSLEQYIQWTKANYFKDSATANLMLANEDPIESQNAW